MNSFNDLDITIMPVSKAHVPTMATKWSENEQKYCRGVRDKKTGRLEELFHVFPVKCIFDDTVQVEFGYYRSGTADAGSMANVKKIDSAWQVIDIYHILVPLNKLAD